MSDVEVWPAQESANAIHRLNAVNDVDLVTEASPKKKSGYDEVSSRQ
jgi:hypothetical protein